MNKLYLLAIALLIGSLGVVGQRERPSPGGLTVGAAAPDFNLSSPDGKTKFKLSSNFGKRPTALIFGSYT